MVYVLSVNGNPLMPCTEAKARHLMQAGKAICVKREPFTIKLTFECENKIQPITLGIDAGYNYIGIVAATENQVLFAAEVELRTEIVDLLSTRRECRWSRRNRKTRYRAPRFDNRVSCQKGGSFDVRKLDGTKISANISYKKLKLLEKRKTFLMQSVKASEIPLQQK